MEKESVLRSEMDEEQRFAYTMAALIFTVAMVMIVSLTVVSIHHDITELRLAEIKAGK